MRSNFVFGSPVSYTRAEWLSVIKRKDKERIEMSERQMVSYQKKSATGGWLVFCWFATRRGGTLEAGGFGLW